MRRLDRNVDDAGSDQPTKRRRSLTPFFSKGVHRYPYLTPSLSPREGGVGGWLVGWLVGLVRTVGWVCSQRTGGRLVYGLGAA